MHANLQTPPTHDGVPFAEPQTCLHAPQWLTSLLVSISQPVDACWSQSAAGAAHVIEEHVPPLQYGPPASAPHARAHRPQLAGSAVVAVSHPSAGPFMQSSKPVAHVPCAHAPWTHVAVALGNAQGAHVATFAHPYAGSVSGTQPPSHAFWLTLHAGPASPASASPAGRPSGPASPGTTPPPSSPPPAPSTDASAAPASSVGGATSNCPRRPVQPARATASESFTNGVRATRMN